MLLSLLPLQTLASFTPFGTAPSVLASRVSCACYLRYTSFRISCGELAHLLLSRGVQVEAGLCDPGAAEVFLKSGLAARCIRVLLEPQEQEMDQALENVRAIEKVLDSGEVALRRLLPFLLHGTEATAWPMMDEAIKRRYDVRVGLEDTFVLRDGRVARGNAELVAEAVRRVRAAPAER